MEKQLHDEACFITLTYSDEFLPEYGTLVRKHLTDFFKRLRKSLEPKKVRYFAVGEYGDLSGRPHYHVILFGHDFSEDRKIYKNGRHPLFQSKALSDLWPFGFANFGTVTFESAAYCARYCLKKVNAHKRDMDVACDIKTGEVYSRIPEYCVMSRRPGIGFSWYEKFGADTRRTDLVVMRGKRMMPPRYFDKLFEKHFPDEFLEIKSKRTVDIENRHTTLDEFLGLQEAERAKELLQSAFKRRTINE